MTALAVLTFVPLGQDRHAYIPFRIAFLIRRESLLYYQFSSLKDQVCYIINFHIIFLIQYVIIFREQHSL